MKPRFILLWIAAVFCGALKGQVRPVSANFNISPPSSVYLSDYTLAGSNKLQLIINQNDENEDFLDVFLDVEITGNGVTLRNNPDFNYEPISLDAGINMLSGSEIEQYLNPANMIISGIDPEEFILSSVLPEGMYNFCVTITDYFRRDKVLSMQSCNTATLLKNNPPQTVFPQCNQPVVAGVTQNLQFNWQANHDNSIMAEYSIKIVEVLPGIEPNDAMNGANTPIAEDLTSTMNTFQYGPDQPQLEIGHTYAYRIDVEDLEGLTTFENDGVGEVCVFEYGYQLGGVVDLISPELGGSLKGEGNTVFQWGGPSNASPGDPVYYRFKIVEIGEGQSPEEAMSSNGLRIDDETDIAANLGSYNYILEEDLGTEAKFAWQVEAYIDDQIVASSEIRPFGTRPFIDHFSAGGRRVEILTITNSDPNAIAGSGTMQLSEDGPPSNVQFSDLKIGIFPSGNLLEEGAMISPIEGGLDVNLENEKGYESKFKATHVVLDTRELRLRGTVEWKLPLASTSTGEVAKVVSKTMDVDFNGYKIVEDVGFENQSFELLDPYGYILEFAESSKFIIRDDNVVIDMTGNVKLPETYKTSSGGQATFLFENVSNLEFFETGGLSNDESFLIFEKDKVYLTSEKAVFDFSDEVSPEKMDADESWKGIYFPTFEINFSSDFDASEQARFLESTSYSFDDSEDRRAWTDSRGLNIKADAEVSESSVFNEFEGNFSSWRIQLEEGAVTNSYVKGFIQIPLLDNQEFSYTAPFTNDGLTIGTLDDDQLDDFEKTLNKGDERTEMTLVIHQASFKDKNRLDCSVSTVWPFLNASNGGPSGGIHSTDFKIYGDGLIGYKGRNNSVPLTQTADGRLGGSFKLVVDSVGAAYIDGQYVFTSSLIVNLGGELSGKFGETRGTLASTEGLSENVDRTLPEYEGEIALDIGYNDGTISLPDINIFIPGIVQVKNSEVQFTVRDSVWGNSFSGGVAVTIFKPKKATIDAKVIIGHNPDTDVAFFYTEVSFGKSDLENFFKDNDKQSDYKNHKQWSKGVVKDITQNKNLQLKLGPVTITSLMLKLSHNIEYSEDEDGEIVFQPSAPGESVWGFGMGLGIKIDDGKKFKGYASGFGLLKDGNLSTLEAMVVGDVSKKVEFNASILLMFDEQRYQISGGVEFDSPICVKAQIWVDIDIPREKVVVDVGREDQKIHIVQGGCAGLGGEGWFHIAIDESIDSIGMELGLGFAPAIEKKGKWTNIIPYALDVRPSFEAQFGIGLFGNVIISWARDPENPDFVMKNIGAYVTASANVEVEINTPLGGDVIPLASVAIGGKLTFNFVPTPVTMSGIAGGTVTLLGVEFAIDFSFENFPLKEA